MSNAGKAAGPAGPPAMQKPGGSRAGPPGFVRSAVYQTKAARRIKDSSITSTTPAPAEQDQPLEVRVGLSRLPLGNGLT